MYNKAITWRRSETVCFDEFIKLKTCDVFGETKHTTLHKSDEMPVSHFVTLQRASCYKHLIQLLDLKI